MLGITEDGLGQLRCALHRHPFPTRDVLVPSRAVIDRIINIFRVSVTLITGVCSALAGVLTRLSVE
jgi:hypothetical protein